MTLSFESVIELLRKAVERDDWEQAARISKLLLEECEKMAAQSNKEKDDQAL